MLLVTPLVILVASLVMGGTAAIAESKSSESSATQDQVVASFERELNHEPSTLPVQRDKEPLPDELYVQVNEPLWTDKQVEDAQNARLVEGESDETE